MRRDDGAALVEFALVLTLLVMTTFGIIEFGRAYNTQVTLTHAAREGVRVLAITGDQGAAITATEDAAASLSTTSLTVEADPCTPGFPTEVRASYPLEFNIPFFGSSTLTLDAAAVMRCGG